MRYLLLSVLLLFSSTAIAFDLNFLVQPLTGTGSTNVSVSWSATESDYCQASGAWSGTKQTSGSESFTLKEGSYTFGITCYKESGRAALYWIDPTQREDNSVLTNLKEILIFVAFENPSLLESQSPISVRPGVEEYTFESLPAGTWYFGAKSVDAEGITSVMSNLVNKTIQPLTRTDSSIVTIQPDPISPPKPPTLITVETLAYDIKFHRGSGEYRIWRAVGEIELGVQCDPNFNIGNGYFGVSSSDVDFVRRLTGPTAVALCQLG